MVKTLVEHVWLLACFFFGVHRGKTVCDEPNAQNCQYLAPIFIQLGKLTCKVTVGFTDKWWNLKKNLEYYDQYRRLLGNGKNLAIVCARMNVCIRADKTISGNLNEYPDFIISLHKPQ